MPEPGESPTNPAPNDDAFADFSDIVKALQDTSGGENAQSENVVDIKDNISTNLVPDIKNLWSHPKIKKMLLVQHQKG